MPSAAKPFSDIPAPWALPLFGGEPIAHLGYFRLEFVERRKWLDEHAYADLVTLCQFLPGPASSQVGMALGLTQRGVPGAVSTQTPAGWPGASIALVAIFFSSFLLVVGILLFWERLRRISAMRRAMPEVDAVVVGLLLAVFYNPVWTSAIYSARDFCLAALAYLLLVFWKLPPWLVVVLWAAIAGVGEV